jgi:CheY-like chemotaxis protein
LERYCNELADGRTMCGGRLFMELNPERRFSLLLVDDEPTILFTLKRVFRNFPYDLHTAENGMAALKVLEQTPVDAALIDLMMPMMNGMELLEHLRNAYPQVQAIILTG